MRLMVRRKPTSSELKHRSFRQARTNAPTLQQLLPAVESVCVDFAFAKGAPLVFGAHQFTVYPPAHAYFAYLCPFGDCDGIYDLNEIVITLLRTNGSQTDGILHCEGHRARRIGRGPPCQLGVTYKVTARYGSEQPAPTPLTVRAS